MLKSTLVILCAICALLPNNASATQGYISDNVFVYIHTGPSPKFRILGSVVSGAKIEIVEQSEDGQYTKIIDDKGRTGWIKSEFSSAEIGIKERFVQLQQTVDNLKNKNEQLTVRSSEFNQNNGQLQQRITSLTNELNLAKREKTEMEAKLIGEDAEIQMKWLLNGGILVFVSILFGILLTFVPGKKKNKGNWS